MLKKHYKKFKREDFPEVCVLKAELVDKFCETVVDIDWYSINYKRVDFISLAAQKFNDCKYLEIGVDKNLTFDAIPVDDKTGVDPNRGGNQRMTSDKFFENNIKMFDVIFVDGLHTFDQCRKDIINSLKCLNVGGYLFIHDLIPRNFMEEFTPQMGEPWCGDVWKVAHELIKTKNIEFSIIVANNGIGILKKLENKVEYFDDYLNLKKLKFNDYLNKNSEINYIKPEEAIKMINKG